MRLATFNFLSGGSSRRCEHWQRIGEHLAPDIFFAQECRPPPPRSWRAGLWVKAAGRNWGTGVYLKRGAIERIPVRGYNGWVTGGQLAGRGRPVRAFSIHCPPGENGYVRTMGRILDRLRPIAKGADLILAGDFNVVMGLRGPAEAVRMSAGERALLERLSTEFGLSACWQAMNPGVPLGQTLRWSGNRALPYHCDGIFVPASWRNRLVSCEIVSGPQWEALSDHNPVVAEFR